MWCGCGGAHTTRKLGMMNEWISVEDKMPENKEEIVLANSDSDNGIILSSARHFSGQRVSHWMPLPEPPKPDGPFRAGHDRINFYDDGSSHCLYKLPRLQESVIRDMVAWLNRLWHRNHQKSESIFDFTGDAIEFIKDGFPRASFKMNEWNWSVVASHIVNWVNSVLAMDS
jgi:hypothetical protein